MSMLKSNSSSDVVMNIKHKYSIALAISAVLSILYAALAIYNFIDGYAHNNLVGAREVIANTASAYLLPHVVCSGIGALFVVIAFFSNVFAMGITACVFLAISIVLHLPFALYQLPMFVLTLLGSAFMYMRKKKLEEEEEHEYRSNNPIAPRVKKSAQGIRRPQYKATDFSQVASPIQSHFQQPLVLTQAVQDQNAAYYPTIEDRQKEEIKRSETNTLETLERIQNQKNDGLEFEGFVESPMLPHIGYFDEGGYFRPQ